MVKTVALKTRISLADAHYGGGLVAGAKILELFGDAATLLLIQNDGTEGLFRAYKNIEFLAPVHAGDFLEIKATLTGVGKSSRHIQFEAIKFVEGSKNSKQPDKAKLLKKPIRVAKAEGVCVVPKKK